MKPGYYFENFYFQNELHFILVTQVINSKTRNGDSLDDKVIRDCLRTPA